MSDGSDSEGVPWYEDTSRSGAQREYDPEAEWRAVKKMKKWEKQGGDPVLAEVKGEPWWKALQRRALEKREKSRTNKQRAGE